MELIHEYEARFRDDEGTLYLMRAYGQERGDGTWAGWLEFVPALGGGPLTTGQETSQPNREALDYWAAGLEPVYFEGAFARAR
jgi:hypothetical protein